MTQIIWNAISEKLYEAGVDRGVLYPSNGVGVPWNGLVSVDEKIEKAKTTDFYYNGVKRGMILLPGDFAATLSAITYPDEFLEFDGYEEFDGVSGVFLENQQRQVFNLCYRTLIGDSIDGLAYGYKLHLLYNLIAEPTNRSRNTLTETVDPNIFSWDLKSTPVLIDGYGPTAHFILDSTKMYPETLQAIEDILYGTVTETPRFVVPEELADLTTIIIVDNGDGTWSATGPAEYIYPSGTGEYTLDVLGINFLEETVYTISSS